MKKYFDVIGPNEAYLLTKVKRFDVVVVEPKYDGSNVLKFGDNLYTRNLNPLPPQWVQIIKTQFPEILRSRYDFYFEFGGTKNSPAGYVGGWRGDWDYVVLDYYEYRYPLDELRAEGLRVVEVLAELDDVYKALEHAIKIVGTEEMKRFEGVVVKIYGVEGDDKKFKDRVLFIKVKHDNVSKWTNSFTRLSRGDVKEEGLERAPDEEIRKELHKILTELVAKGVNISSVGLNEVWTPLQKELAKHGYNLEEGDKARVRQMLREVKREFKK